MVNYEDCIVFLLAKAYQKAHGNIKKHLSPYSLTPIQNLILEALRDEDGLSAGEVGKKLSLDNATLSGVLDRMAEREWIVKQTNPEDKRLLRIYLTDKAKALKEKLAEEREQANEEILRGLEDRFREMLARQLQINEQTATLDAKGVANWARPEELLVGSLAQGEHDLAAEAADEGYERDPTRTSPIPFHGYYFRILTRQGPDAPGGASDYVVNGDMTGGFAAIAYPAEYGNSGIMTFIVGPDAVVFESDLGEETSRIAGEIDAFDPGDGWYEVDE